MRLIFIPVFILILFILLAIFTPVLLLTAFEPIIPADAGKNAAYTLTDLSSTLGRYDTALDLCDYIITLEPESGVCYAKKASILQSVGKLDDAISALNGAIARDPDNIEYYLKKGRILRALHNFSDATQSYKQIDELSPVTNKDLILKGDAALDQSKYLQAYYWYQQALHQDPSDAVSWEKCGDVIFALLTIPTAGQNADESLRSRDLYTEGIRSYENALHLDPSQKETISKKIEKRSDVYVPKSIAELNSRYKEYRYIE